MSVLKAVLCNELNWVLMFWKQEANQPSHWNNLPNVSFLFMFGVLAVTMLLCCPDLDK